MARPELIDRAAKDEFVVHAGRTEIGKVGAVVVGGDLPRAWNCSQSRFRGIPICAVDDEYSIARFSKYTTEFVKLPGLKDETRTVSGLLELGKRLELRGWVLYPTRDELVAAFSRHRAELGQIFRIPAPGWDCVKWAWDKRKTYELARQLEIPIPPTCFVQHAGRPLKMEFPPPFAIKPAVKEHFVYATKAKAWRADSQEELETLIQKASEFMDPAELIVQEVIPGGGNQQFSYCAFFRNGRAVGSMVVKRRRQHPLQFGRASTYVETVDAPILEQLSERFLRAINYYGLVEVEFKLDPRDSQYKLLDVNARTWGYHSLGAKAGVDFSSMLYDDQLGLPVAESRGQTGISWVRMATDIPAALVGLFRGDVNIGAYFKSLRTCDVEAVFSARDILPGLAEISLIPYLAFKKGF